MEKRLEALCATIQECPAELWQERNRAMLELTEIVEGHSCATPTEVLELFPTSVFRLLREPIKSMISDLRSQQVRDTCAFLGTLSKVCRDHVRLFLRDVFPALLDALKVPNKVMSAYVDDCIRTMIANANFKSCLPMIIAEVKESKAKYVRERCIDYVHLVLETWELGEREADMIFDAVRTALEDASVRGRENARFAFLALRAVFPRHAEVLFADLPPAVQSRIDKIEEDMRSEDGGLNDEKKRKARRMSHVDDAVASIQALMRGALTRRLSSVPATDSPGHGDAENTSGLENSLSRRAAPPSPLSSSFVWKSGSDDAAALDTSVSAEASIHLVPGGRAVIGDVQRVPLICGTVRFVGETAFASGMWVGLELDSAIGKNDGSVQGIEYFTCAPNRGIFVRPDQVDTSMFTARTSSPQQSGTSPSSKEKKKYLQLLDRTSGLLKVKVWRSMQLVQQQLELAEKLDASCAQDKPGAGIGANALVDLMQKMNTLNAREQDICERFRSEAAQWLQQQQQQQQEQQQ